MTARPFRLPCIPRLVPLLLLGQIVLCPNLGAQAFQPLSAIQTVSRMVQAEGAAWSNREHFLYKNAERSNRTNGHLWNELIVETSEGPLHRLIDVDGRPLSGG